MVTETETLTSTLHHIIFTYLVYITTDSLVSQNIFTNHIFDFENPAIIAFIRDKN